MSQHPNNQMASGSVFYLTKPESSGLKNNTISSCVSDYEAAWSPTSPLEFILFPSLVNPFGGSSLSSIRKTHKKSWDSGKVGLSIVDSLDDDHHIESSRILLPSPDSKNIIFESLLRTRNTFVNNNNNNNACLESVDSKEMKRRCCGIKKESIFVIAPLDLTTITDVLVLPPNDFLSSCFFCNKKLGMGKDIYMYRGYKAFCSVECRLEVIYQDEKMEEEEAKSGSSSE
ncbi:unnamed protein product [Brassica rapa subsp. narinosa]